jgi:hypothetical protein
MEKYGDDLKPVIDKLAIDKSSDLKAAKKNLTKLRKEAKGYKVK